MRRIRKTLLLLSWFFLLVILSSCAAPRTLVDAGIEKEESTFQEDTRFVAIKGKVLDLKDDLHLTDYHRSAFVPTGSDNVFILLESKSLEEVEEKAKGKKEVTVSGTVTQYRGRNYLLLPPIMGALGEEESLIPEETRLIDRAGRLYSSEELGLEGPVRSVFVTKAGGDIISLLENLNLEMLERATRRSEKEVAVSGTVMVYRGKNYLLLTRTSKNLF